LQHYPGHLVVGITALVATWLISTVTANRLIKRKLKLSFFLFGAYVLANIVVAVPGGVPGLPSFAPGSAVDSQLRSFEQLAFAAGLINLLVVSLINPLRADRVPDAFPSILQDAIVIGILVLVATFVFEDKLLTTSAVGAVVVGFALQDVCGARDSKREAVQDRRLDPRRRVRRTRRRGHVACDEAPHQDRQLRRRSEQ
jgi:hypothetical protein